VLVASIWTKEKGINGYRFNIFAINEFDFPFPHFDILLREKIVIIKLQGFGMVSIIGLNPNLARSGDLALLAIQIGMYTRV